MKYKGERFRDSLPCLIGWRKNVISLISFSEYLRSEFNIIALDIHNCSQDSVENFSQEYVLEVEIEILLRLMNSSLNIENLW